MTSAAYKRESNANAAALAKDPANDLFSHFNRRRLEAEEIRDASLQVTGELTPTCLDGRMKIPFSGACGGNLRSG